MKSLFNVFRSKLDTVEWKQSIEIIQIQIWKEKKSEKSETEGPTSIGQYQVSEGEREWGRRNIEANVGIVPKLMEDINPKI